MWVAANQLLCTHQTFCKSLMVAVAVWKLSCSVWCLWTLAWRLMAATSLLRWWTVVETIAANDPLTIQFGHFCCLFIGKVELSCCKVQRVHMKQVWWYIKYTFCYHYCCLRYISGKYCPNWSRFNAVIAEVKGVTFFWNTVYICYKMLIFVREDQAECLVNAAVKYTVHCRWTRRSKWEEWMMSH